MDIRRWESFKAWQLEGLEEHIRAGRVDRPIIPFLRTVNRAEGIVTTSSCAGRVMLISAQRRKKDSLRLYIEHERIDKEAFMEALSRLRQLRQGEPYFKLEPFIYHFVARDLERAERLVDAVFKAGVKRVGMRPIRFGRYLVEFMGTTRISIPLAFASVEWEAFLPYAQAKLEENAERRRRVEEAILRAFGVVE